jgi:hypothetical protein
MKTSFKLAFKDNHLIDHSTDEKCEYALVQYYAPFAAKLFKIAKAHKQSFVISEHPTYMKFNKSTNAYIVSKLFDNYLWVAVPIFSDLTDIFEEYDAEIGDV